MSVRVPGDGNFAASQAAFKLSEVAFIYPITPATPMGDYFDSWIAKGQKNIWGNPIKLSTLQSEGGAAGALHGAASVGSIATTFTASQGLLLMIPDLYKLAGEFCPAVLHVTARSLATGGLSIYNDHGDIYAAKASGIPMIFGHNVQESHDIAALSHLTTIKAGVPFMNIFDGFRTSHEINTYTPLTDDQIRPLIDEEAIAVMRSKSLNPEHPSVRGPILGPEFVWTSVEKGNSFYDAIPGAITGLFKDFGKQTGRYYKPYEFVGPADAKYAIVAMGAGTGPIENYVTAHPSKKIGILKVRLYRPFSAKLLNEALPPSVNSICVLDKYRDATAAHEPLYLDVVSALHGLREFSIVGGRYGIGSKDFGPAHVDGVVKNLLSAKPRDSFTIGITSAETEIPLGDPIDPLPEGTKQSVFWGLGSDGTVGSNKEAIKLIVDNTPLYGQAYFAYSAHKSGGLTNSHVRFGPKPIDASYFIANADYIGVHNPSYINKFDTIKSLKDNGVVVLNIDPETDFDTFLPDGFKKKIAEKNARLYAIDASKIAAKLGLPGRINMLMQTVFFKLADIIPEEKVIGLLKKSIVKQFIKKGQAVVDKNCSTVDAALSNLVQVRYNKDSWNKLNPVSTPDGEGFDKILKMQIEQRADDISVDDITLMAAMPPGTSKVEKRNIALNVPTWDTSKCVQCNTCSMVCPHAVIRPFLLKDNEVQGLQVLNASGGGLKGYKFRIQISPYDCTGCGVCAKSCPAKALTMKPNKEPAGKNEDENFQRLVALPNRGSLTPNNNLKNIQFNQPLLEFNGACPGCGEPAIIKLITQLYGDQIYIANATGCSIVWGGTYPWNPYTTNSKGYGPAWANSLFEDNAEFGFGMYHSVVSRRNNVKDEIQRILKNKSASSELQTALAELVEVWDSDKSTVAAEKVKALLPSAGDSKSIKYLRSQSDVLAKKAVWILGGDGWGYDIGYGGLDHVLASGDNVNVVVLDTEVYSNTGGQSSKATNRGAVAQFAANGYSKAKKDLGHIAMTYQNIYVGSTCLLANPAHALKVVQEAASYEGPSLILNYAPCINHGIDGGLTATPKHCKDLVNSGYITLYRYDPRKATAGGNPFQLDSKKPTFNIDPLIKEEVRFRSLEQSYKELATLKRGQLVEDLKSRWEKYSKMATK